MMLRRGMTVDRETYIGLAHMGTPPEPWTFEDESSLPDELQDWSRFHESEGGIVLKPGVGQAA